MYFKSCNICKTLVALLLITNIKVGRWGGGEVGWLKGWGIC